MVRKTKEDAELTRLQILDAARSMFALHGVSGTSLDQIAKEAGVTRGAIYWHFENKVELFFAMREQVSIPLYDRLDVALKTFPDDPLSAIEQSLLQAIESLENDQATRTTFEIITMKCEYVGEFAEMKQQKLQSCEDFISKVTEGYQRAHALGQILPCLDPAMAALETCTLMIGIYQIWLSDIHDKLIRSNAKQLIRNHIQQRRCSSP